MNQIKMHKCPLKMRNLYITKIYQYKPKKNLKFNSKVYEITITFLFLWIRTFKMIETTTEIPFVNI